MRPVPRIGGLAVCAAFAALIAAQAAGSVFADTKGTPPTVETAIGSDGAALTTRVLTSSGSGTSTSDYSGSAPIKTTILYTLNGQPASRDQLKGARGPMTATYRVQNDTGKAQDVSYLGSDGQTHALSTVTQVPFVATVEATIPRSFSNVQAEGASISTAADGLLHASWSMVLFSPIGSPSQEASFSAQADSPSGLPGLVVRARPINPGASQALSGDARAANAAITQNDLMHARTTAADDGLTKLRDGTGKLVDGLSQLHDGSQKLSAGLGDAAAGSQKLANGLHTADAGGHQLADAFKSPTGAADLQGGSAALAAGIKLIDAGLATLADPTTGLPKAKAGSAALGVGVGKLLAGLGDYSTSPVPSPPTILYGLKASRDGLTGITGGVACIKADLVDIANGAAAVVSSPCWGPSGHPSFAPPVPSPKYDYLLGLANKLSNPGCSPDCGVVQGLDAINTGSTSGLGKVTGGLLLVKGGLSNPLCNPCGVLEGLGSLTAGLTTAVNGVNQLHAGSTTASAGAAKLSGGINTAGAGAAKLAAGLDQLAAGADQLSAGVPTAVAGSKKIAAGLGSALDGAGQVNQGLADLQTKAIGPLGSQLIDGSSNARLELATIDATGARAATAPQGADATWLYRLDAVIATEDQTTRNLGLGAVGVIVLLLVAGGGFLLGRRAG